MIDTTTLILCPICNQGYLTLHKEPNTVTHENVTEDLDMEYYNCLFCGDQVDSELSKRNKQRMLDFRERVSK